MTRTPYRYPALLEPNEKGRLVVHFPDLPEALTDGADAVEAFAEAPNCLSTALAARVVDNEDIPAPSPVRPRSIPGGAGCDDIAADGGCPCWYKKGGSEDREG